MEVALTTYKNKTTLMKKTILLLGLALAFASCANDSTLVYKDPTAPLEKRLDDLLDRMTIDEMIAQVNLLPRWEHNDSSVRASIAQDKVGAILKSCGTQLNRSLQEDALRSSRLGIPLMFHEDIIHGYRTIFPIPLAEACSWDREQVRANSAAIAREAASAGVQLTYAPMVDISTDGRWGRIMETSGEDPYLTSELAVARVKGFQGDDLSDPYTIMACVKHFAGYAKLGAGLDYLNSEFSLRELEETYLPPYRACIEAGVGSLMESYTIYDGIPVSYSKFLLNDVLRDELHFDGLLMTDWKTMYYAIKEGAENSESESVRKAINAGIDMDMASEYSINHLKQLYDEGKVSKERIRDAAYHCLKAKFQMGLFDDPFRYFDEEREKKEVRSAEIRNTARKAASGSMVLLKNDGILPLKKGSSVTVVGPFADGSKNYLGNWSASGKAEDVIGVKEAAVDVFSVRNSAPVAIVCIGEPREIIGEGVSTGKLEIEPDQIAILKKHKAAGRKVVAVLFNGRPLCLSNVLDNCDALLEAWYPGTEGGLSVVDILCGDVNPSGKLVQTFPRHVGQVPIQYNPLRTFGYVYHADIEKGPEFPFGFGLSYTTYKYSQPRVEKEHYRIGETVKVSVDVTNTGNRVGEEVIQLYIADLVASVVPREKMLKEFAKVSIEPGQSRTVEFELAPDAFKIYDAEHNWTIEPGEWRIEVGPSSANTSSITILMD